MDLQLKDKKALVTGSSMGIGKAIAAALAREGAFVILNGRSEQNVQKSLQELQASIPQGQFATIVADLGTNEGCQQAIQEQPEIDILVNNLGIFEASDFFETSDEQWQKIFDINIMSGVRLCRHYLKRMMEKRWGRIVFISSESGVSPAPEMAHYSATKTMQLAIARSLAEIAKGTNVTVNSVLPGPTRTEGVSEFIHSLFPGEKPEVAERKFMQENRPTSLIERLIQPEEVAALVTLICSPLAGIVDGAALRAEGGLVRSVF
ncbi:SDR family NAD(P)-dependent oxidoreductase [Ktedonobacter racemifer]|uniref:Short-chain dehydrogenase/reductase SDR n=1 Tax=Ktedonobacter racemifer DSM 44963 TaxID=485913 RepID=D6TYH0_KTERA|nr:SDR family oxidoreductase [Ktedonobacter racemifer]EFH83250.1 short-chain dehydrogenase/reductase SDR [Ktedonobacter racemifer DSM 44963]